MHDLSRGGAGVARDAEGRVLFVPFAAPGDLVRVRFAPARDERERYRPAELLEVLEPSPERVPAPCAVFGRCGGCQWQHLPYALQWKTKAGGVRQALARVQVGAPALWDEMPAERVWEYRNRVQLRGERGTLGFFAAGSNQLVPIERCEIARPEINARLPALREEAARRPERYKIEVEVGEGPAGAVAETWNARHAARGFRQAHDEQNARLRQWVAERLRPAAEAVAAGGPNPHGLYDLYDLFGGSGNLSRGLAGAFRQVHCVDLGAPRDAPAEMPANVSFHRASVGAWLARQAPTGRPAFAILDPPREGLGAEAADILLALGRLGVSLVAHIGCDVDAWARDVARMTRQGWRLERVGALDFFPQTPHVECLAFLRL